MCAFQPQKAWEEAPLGPSVYGEWFIHKDNKILVSAPKIVRKPEVRAHDIVAYPLFEHYGNFLLGGSALHGGGPEADHPGSIGSLRLNELPVNKVFSISYVQAHYKAVEGGISRSLATKYAGWRKRAFEHAIRFAAEKGYSLRLDPGSASMAYLFGREYAGGEPQVLRDLRAACKSMGATISKTGSMYKITPKTQHDR